MTLRRRILLYLLNKHNQKNNKNRGQRLCNPKFSKKCCITGSIYPEKNNICCPREFLKFLHIPKINITKITLYLR